MMSRLASQKVDAFANLAHDELRTVSLAAYLHSADFIEVWQYKGNQMSIEAGTARESEGDLIDTPEANDWVANSSKVSHKD